jgi:hypothetical protein
MHSPCWTREKLEAVVNQIADVSDVGTSQFLATHSPISNLVEKDTNGNILLDGMTERAVFEKISSFTRTTNLIFVYGPPGTGKSHFINWVRITYQQLISSGEIKDVIPVLVRRRNGSLKDALEQLVEQLPDEFIDYLRPIREAIDQLSDGEARQMLANLIHAELTVNWPQHSQTPLPRTLRSLPQAFHELGFGEWLRRNGSVIAENIQLLISDSEIEDRDTPPEFTELEFNLDDPNAWNPSRNIPGVLDLIDDLTDNAELREKAAEICNTVLKTALIKMAGLGNQNLSSILRDIRRDLKRQGKKLVLLIEDVSVMNVLNEDILNAVEPSDDTDLCQLTSVIGMTEVGFRRIRDNQKERAAATFGFSNSNNAEGWYPDDAFVARYLNAARLNKSAFEDIATHRKNNPNGDVNVTACEDCQYKQDCHKIFGSVTLDRAEIGLYPFTEGVAARMMEAISERSIVARTQRSFLTNFFVPTLNSFETNENPALPVDISTPIFWSEFRQKFTDNWSPQQKDRIGLTLARFWSTATTAEDAVRQLNPLLPFFGLSEISDVPIEPEKVRGSDDNLDPPPPPPTTPPPQTNPLLNSLQNWRSGGQLIQATKFRDPVFRFLKNSLPIYDPERLSPGTVKFFLSQSVDVIDFENADNSARNRIFCFERNEANANFLEALLYLTDEEKAQRSEILIWEKNANLWLRQNEQSIIDQLETGPNYRELVKSAAKFLALMQQLINKTPIPNDELDYCQFVLQPIDVDKFSALGKDLSSLVRDLPVHLEGIRNFVISEVSLKQGTGGDNFIDPEPIIEGVKAARKSLQLTKISEELFSGRFASRYQSLQLINKWASFPELINEEIRLISEKLDSLRSIIAKRGLINDDASIPMKQYFDEVLELDKVLREVEVSYNEENWDACKRQLESDQHFSTIVEKIEEVIASPNPGNQLQIDTHKLQGVEAIITICEAFLDRAEKDLEQFLPNDTGSVDTMAKIEKSKNLLDVILSLIEDKAAINQERDHD